MLMVTALRCRNTADNFLPQYNRFVTKHNALIGSQNNVLKSHFAAKPMDAGGALNALDRMSIGFANSYGNGHKRMGCKLNSRPWSKLAISLRSRMALLTMAAIADETVDAKSWAGQTCPTRIAGRK